MSGVVVGFPTDGRPLARFMASLFQVKAYDDAVGHKLNQQRWMVSVEGTNITTQRNKIVEGFLDHTDGEWLWFVDTDQTFDPDIIDRLVASADPEERPILSGVVIAYRPERDIPLAPACVMFDDEDPPRLVAPLTIPPQRFWFVGASGAGCLLIHRTVLEKMRDARFDPSFPWFNHSAWRRKGDDGEHVDDMIGEDYTFSLRAARLGYPVVLDTDIHLGHIKDYEFKVGDFWRQAPPHLVEARTYVIIPVKDQMQLTKNLVKQLEEQRGFHEIVLVDNGSKKDMRRWLERSGHTVLNGADMGIHEMWNLAIRYTRMRWPKCNLAILNNDLKLGPDFIPTLAKQLREGPENLVAISPNYDGHDNLSRNGEQVSEHLFAVKDICANRYDGTGGACGFAFMVKSELFDFYSFPDRAKWWFGDNDMLLTIQAGKGMWCLTDQTTVEHIDGGGKTGNWDAYIESDQYRQDRAAFVERWTG